MTNRSSLTVLLLALTAAVAVAQPMSGTYYIQKGVSSDNTFPSFVEAGNALQSRGLGGDVTFLAYAGDFNEGTCYLQSISGSSSYTATFDKKPGEGEVLVRGGSCGFYVYYTDKVKVKNLTIRATTYGIYSLYSGGVKVEKCNIIGSSYGAILYNGNYDSVVGCYIRTTTTGVYFYSSSSPRSTGNHMSNSMVLGYSNYAIQSSYNDAAEIYDNTFVGASSYMVAATSATNWRVKGNIFKQNGSYILYMPNSGLMSCDYNDLYNANPSGYIARYGSVNYQTLSAWQASGFDLNSIAADPLACGWNLHLREGSPCIDRGVAIPGITADIDGDSRDLSPDIGADEYTTGSPMSGVYTIKQDGSGDYASFFDAIWDVWGRGFAGDVTFDVFSGTYAEQIRCFDLGNGDHFLTFRAHAGTSGPDDVLISPSDFYAVWLTDASRIKFTDLNFSGYSSYGAYHQTLTTVTPYKGCDTVTYRRCTFAGASIMNWGYSSNYDSVVDCKLYPASYYGIYSPGSSSYPSGPNVFINNFIVGSFTSVGIFSNYSSGNQYYYNTIYSPSCNYDVYERYSTGNAPLFRDNIFYNGNPSASAYAVVLDGTVVPPTSALDYNCWWCPAGTYVANINATGHTWATLRTAGYEEHGINQDPTTGGVLNPHLRDYSPCIDAGVSVPGITEDIDGDSRLANTPDIGADEWTGTVGEPMSGVYTVKLEGGGDFPSINAALYALAVRGFGGDVQFDVYDGTYNGMYNLRDVGNGINWLTFRAYPGENVILDAGANSYNWYMCANKRVRIDGFEMTGAKSSGVYMYYAGSAPYNGCDTCVIRNNTISAPAGIYNYYADDDTIDGNTINATSSYGVYLNGYSAAGQYNVRNVITDNTISGFSSYGIYASCQDYLRIRGNTITGPIPIYVRSGSYDTISDNCCHSTPSSYGIFIYGSSSSPYSQGFVIANNMIDGANYGLAVWFTSGAKLIYNSVHCSNTGYYGLYSYFSYGLTMHNNIFYGGPSGYATYWYYGDAFPASSDNNDLYTGGSQVIYHYPEGAMDLATWQLMSGKDVNSISADPLFKSATDDHLLAGSPCIGAGVPYAGFETDIDGDTRSVWLPPIGPCIGADEYVLPAGWAEMAELPAVVGGGGWLAHKPGERYLYAARGNQSGDFYRYDFATNVWSPLASVPAYGDRLPYWGARGVHGGDCLYATSGNGTGAFWRYNINEDKWEALRDVPDELRGGTDLVCVPGTPGHVYLASGQKGEFYRYDVASNEWTDLGMIPGKEKWKSGSFLTFDGGKTIYAHRSDPVELRTYDVETGTWTDSLPGMPGEKPMEGGCGDWYDGVIYSLKGATTSEFWQWDATSHVWDALGPIPGSVDSGADIISWGNGTIFALQGGKTTQFWRYVLEPETREGVQSAIIKTREGRIALAVPCPLVGPTLNLRYSAVRPGPVQFTLFDILGRSVVKRDFIATGAGRLAVDVRNLSAGVYLVRLDDGKQHAVRKLVIQR